MFLLESQPTERKTFKFHIKMNRKGGRNKKWNGRRYLEAFWGELTCILKL